MPVNLSIKKINTQFLPNEDNNNPKNEMEKCEDITSESRLISQLNSRPRNGTAATQDGKIMRNQPISPNEYGAYSTLKKENKNSMRNSLNEKDTGSKVLSESSQPSNVRSFAGMNAT